LEAVVEHVLPCKNMQEVAAKLNAVVEGHNDPAIKSAIQRKVQKQVSELFGQ
jgi:hypothetical protein